MTKEEYEFSLEKPNGYYFWRVFVNQNTDLKTYPGTDFYTPFWEFKIKMSELPKDVTSFDQIKFYIDKIDVLNNPNFKEKENLTVGPTYDVTYLLKFI